MSCIAGRGDVISVADSVGRRAGGPVSMFGGTLNGNALGGSVGLAVLDVLARPGTYERLWALGERLRGAVRKSAADHGLAVDVLGTGPFLQVFFTDDPVIDVASMHRADRAMARQFGLELVRRGVLNGLGKMYVSVVHSDEDMDEAIAAFDGALAALA